MLFVERTDCKNAMDRPRHPQVIRPWKPVRRVADRVQKLNPRAPARQKKRGK